jgi:translation initiation factor IF-1
LWGGERALTLAVLGRELDSDEQYVFPAAAAHDRDFRRDRKEQGNGFYLVTLEQPAGHQCLCRAAGKLTKFRIKLLAGDKVLVEISPYDLSRGRITYRERNAAAGGPRPGGNRPGGPRRR